MTDSKEQQSSPHLDPIRGSRSANEALAGLRSTAQPTARFPQQATWAKRLARVAPDLTSLRPLRVAVLGGGTLDHFAQVLRFWLAVEGFRADIYLAPYGAFRQEILNAESGLYAFQPEIVWLFATGRDAAFDVGPGASPIDSDAAVNAAASEWRSLWRHLSSNGCLSIIQNNFDAPSVRAFGQLDGTLPSSRATLIRRLNLALTEAAGESGVSIFDLEFAASLFGLARWHEDRQWYRSKQPFAPDAFGSVGFQAARFLGAMKGGAKKCVVLDLDNVLWGGVVGDDGVSGIKLGNDPEGEPFVAFQAYLRTLMDRGILLAVCSKNEDAVAREPFLAHPAMRLRLEDIVVFRANWLSKVDNLREIANALNIGLDSLVFVDDNPLERELVRTHLSEVAVPEMSADPADYVAILSAGRYFESISFSKEDSARTRSYVDNAKREALRAEATDISSFLQDLDMEAECGPVNALRLPRMAQLLARTNQFHPTTTRHTEAEVAAFAADANAWVRWFSLRDRLGDHGLVSVVILVRELDALRIDTWAMSCRVFSRGLEELAFLEMVQAAKGAGVRYLIGRYSPTPKNRPVADLFPRMGFTTDGGDDSGTRWILDLSATVPAFAPFIRIRHESLQAGNGATWETE